MLARSLIVSAVAAPLSAAPAAAQTFPNGAITSWCPTRPAVPPTSPRGWSTNARRRHPVLAGPVCGRGHAEAGRRPAQWSAELALADPKVLKSFADGGMSAFPSNERSPEAATAKLRSEIKRWGEVIRANNIAAAP